MDSTLPLPLSAPDERGGTGQTALEQLWRSRLKVIASNLENGEEEYREIANLADHIGRDYHGRFLIELLQNASDQATRAGVELSRATIVRTRSLVGVCNEGKPFDHSGLKEITSLGISHKEAAIHIGNKGVGFKAVYQVTGSPEIFSASSRVSSCHPRESLATSLETSIQLSTQPFENEELMGFLNRVGQDCVSTHAGATQSLTIDRLMEAVREAAPFKFPLPLPPSALKDRVVALGLTTEDLQRAQTLVVLPLLDDPGTQAAVERAINELSSADEESPGSLLLFLSGIGELIIRDLVRDRTIRVTRSKRFNETQLSRGRELYRVTTSVMESAASSNSKPRTRTWIAVSRSIGSAADGVDANAERMALQQAASTLPGKGWDDISVTTVTVALPIAPNATAATLGSSGRFCIGLPTLEPTGAPAWVDGHFHGNISRTKIDFSTSYNELLFRQVLGCFEGLLDALKASTEVGERRMVTLAFEQCQTGHFADALFENNGLAHSKIVLASDGDDYLLANDAAVPDRKDLEETVNGEPLFWRLLEGIPAAELEALRIRLPHRTLIEAASQCLNDLGIGSFRYASSDPYLTRRHESRSIVERAALRHRASGTAFWEPFLRWITTSFDTSSSALRDQRILPVGADGIASASDSVFLLPSRAGDQDDEVSDTAEVPPEVLTILNFLDESAIRTRGEDGRTLTGVALRLSPGNVELSLVRRPRLTVLLNQALAPQLRDAITKDRQLAFRLLLVALKWVLKLGPDRSRTLRVDVLRVPTVDGSWSAPGTTYFANGWLGDEDRESLLHRAYGHDPSRVLVSWSDFKATAFLEGPEPSREEFAKSLELIGVASRPRIVRSRFQGSVLVSSWRKLFAKDVACPDDLPASSHWAGYLAQLSKGASAFETNFPYGIAELAWIDGLEREESRQSVIDLIRGSASVYLAAATTTLRRVDIVGKDSTTIEALWVYAIRTSGWAVIRSSTGRYATSGGLFIVTPDDLRHESLQLLPHVSPRDAFELDLLTRFGLRRLDEAEVGRIVYALQVIASTLAVSSASELQHVEALVTRVFGVLADRLQATPDAGLPSLTAAPIPLFQADRRVVPIDVGSGDGVIYYEDDPIRAAFVAGWSTALRLPRLRRHEAHLVAALRATLGQRRVLLTSEAPVETGFSATSERVSLLSWLEEFTPTRSIRLDLVGLVTFTSTSAPRHDAIRRAARLLDDRWLERGRFRSREDMNAFYDHEHATLYVADRLSKFQAIEQAWLLLGQSHRDAIAAYSRALQTGDADEFLRTRTPPIGPAEMEEVRVALGLTGDRIIELVRPILLGFWTRLHASEPDDVIQLGFQRDVDPKDLTAASTVVGCSGLPALLATAMRQAEDRREPFLVEACGLEVDLWQRARRLLGLAPFVFPDSARHWTKATSDLGVGLRAHAARLSSVPLGEADHAIRAVSQLPVPSHVEQRPYDEASARREVLLSTLELPSIRRLELLWGAIDKLVRASTLDPQWPDLGTKRERDLYQRIPDDERARHADHDLNELLTVALPLALKLGETIAREKVLDHSRVVQLRTAPWANRFAALQAAREVMLAESCARTIGRLSAARAFSEPPKWRELWLSLQEILGPLPTEASDTAPPPPPKVSLLGLEQTRKEIEGDLLSGRAGAIATKLLAQRSPNLDLARLRGKRGPVSAPQRGRGNRRGRGSRGKRPQDSQADRELNGLLGETFLFLDFSGRLPDFDETCWVSSNASRFGIAGEEDDDLGYDFDYYDETGVLCGVRGRRCFIEVKATSGDGSAPFPMSANEWDMARSCHESDNSTGDIYIIVRVAYVRSKPTVVDVVVDPFRVYRDGALDFSQQSLWIYLGSLAD